MSRKCINDCIYHVTKVTKYHPAQAHPKCAVCCEKNKCSDVGNFNPKKSQMLTLVKPMAKPVPVKRNCPENGRGWGLCLMYPTPVNSH